MGSEQKLHPTEDVDNAFWVTEGEGEDWESWDEIPIALYEEEDRYSVEDDLWITSDEEQHINEILRREINLYQTTWVEEGQEGELKEIVVEGSRYGNNMGKRKRSQNEEIEQVLEPE